MSNEDIDGKVAALKPGETFQYTRSISGSSGSGSFQMSTTVSWTRGDDGKLTCSYFDLDNTIVTETYDESGSQKISETRKAQQKRNSYISGDLFKNTTTNFGENGEVKERSVDLTNMYNSLASFPSNEIRVFLERNKKHYPTQTVRNDAGEAILTLKDGEYYNSKGKKVDADKAHDILYKAYKKGQITDINQIK